MVRPFNSSPVPLHGPLHQAPVLLKHFWQRLGEEGMWTALLLQYLQSGLVTIAEEQLFAVLQCRSIIMKLNEQLKRDFRSQPLWSHCTTYPDSTTIVLVSIVVFMQTWCYIMPLYLHFLLPLHIFSLEAKPFSHIINIYFQCHSAGLLHPMLPWFA